MFKHENGGTPYTVKAARTVWSGGKDGDDLKTLPIAIFSAEVSSLNFIPNESANCAL